MSLGLLRNNIESVTINAAYLLEINHFVGKLCKLYCKSSFIHPLSYIVIRITNSLAKHLYWFKKVLGCWFYTPHKKRWWLKHGLTTSEMPTSYRELFLWGVTLPCLIVCVKGKYVFSILVEMYFLWARQMKCHIFVCPFCQVCLVGCS